MNALFVIAAIIVIAPVAGALFALCGVLAHYGFVFVVERLGP